MNDLMDMDIERFSRQLILDGWSVELQAALSRVSVLVSPGLPMTAYYLAAMGIGRIVISDVTSEASAKHLIAILGGARTSEGLLDYAITLPHDAPLSNEPRCKITLTPTLVSGRPWALSITGSAKELPVALCQSIESAPSQGVIECLLPLLILADVKISCARFGYSPECP